MHVSMLLACSHTGIQAYRRTGVQAYWRTRGGIRTTVTIAEIVIRFTKWQRRKVSRKRENRNYAREHRTRPLRKRWAVVRAPFFTCIQVHTVCVPDSNVTRSRKFLQYIGILRNPLVLVLPTDTSRFYFSLRTVFALTRSNLSAALTLLYQNIKYKFTHNNSTREKFF